MARGLLFFILAQTRPDRFRGGFGLLVWLGVLVYPGPDRVKRFNGANPAAWLVGGRFNILAGEHLKKGIKKPFLKYYLLKIAYSIYIII